jgi:cell division protein FtsZ
VKIFGVGGAGVNIVGSLHLKPFPTVSCAVVDTDTASLAASPVSEKIQIGKVATRGQGASRDAKLGGKAAHEDAGLLAQSVEGSDLVFIVASTNGGTGGGVTPLLATLASDAHALVIIFAVTPLSIEGGRDRTMETLEQLRSCAEALIPVENSVFEQTKEGAESVEKTFALASNFVELGITALYSMLFNPALPRKDMAALRGAFPVRDGRAFLVTGYGSDTANALKQIASEIRNPAHKPTKRPANALLISIQSGTPLLFSEIRTIVESLKQEFSGHENILTDVSTDTSLGNAMRLCVIGVSGGISQRAPERISSENGDSPLSALNPSPHPKIKMTQKELDFDLENKTERPETFFGRTSSEKIHGQNVDEPTYLRLGIKLPI